MIIESAIRLAFAAGCLTAIHTLPTAHAQMGGTARKLLDLTRRLWLWPPARRLWLWCPARRLWLWPPARRLWLWRPARRLCPAEPACPVAALRSLRRNPADNQRPADQPR